MKITEADHSTLARALVLEQAHAAGIFPTGGSQHRHFESLASRDLLDFEDYGFDIDGEVEKEVKIYRLTGRGRALAEALEWERRVEPQCCTWTEDGDGVWETACGEAYCFTDGGPRENRSRFCPYCGKPLAVKAKEDAGESTSYHDADCECWRCVAGHNAEEMIARKEGWGEPEENP